MIKSLLSIGVMALIAGCSSNPPAPFVACQLSTGQAFVAQANGVSIGYVGAGFYLPEVNVMCPQPIVTQRPFVSAIAASSPASAAK